MQAELLTPIHREIVDCLFDNNTGNADSIAVEGVIHNLQNPKSMTNDVFLQLQRLEDRMEMAAAQGQDCTNGFHERFTEVARLIDAAPWVMCPDKGCVSKSAIMALPM